MKCFGRVVAGLSVLTLLFVLPASAQESGSMKVGDATVTVGGGMAMLTLPDVSAMLTQTTNTDPFPVLQSYKFSDDFGDEVGWNVSGSIAVPLNGANGGPDEISLNGFWVQISDDDGFNCTGNAVPQINCLVAPLVDDPTIVQVNGILGGNQIHTSATRDVDQWGASLESKWLLSQPYASMMQVPKSYVALGGDVRGIDQNLDAIMTSAVGTRISYGEDLDTTYYGAYVAFGGDYSGLFFKGLWDALGLESSFRLQGGIYYADTDYNGRMVSSGTTCGGCGDPTGSLSLSSGDAAFIGGLTLETRKRIGPRTTLSLKSEYEYYSWVPKMAYNNTDRTPLFNVANSGRQDGTVIEDDDAFSMRTSLRLSIGLGPSELYNGN